MVEAPNRADYPLVRSLPTRWQDVDIYGHVNNAVYFSYFDTAINAWYVERGLIALPSTDALFLVAANACDFLAEIRFPETVDVGIRVERLGTSSVTYDIGLFVGERACARGRYTHVLVDTATRRPTAIEGTRRLALEELT